MTGKVAITETEIKLVSSTKGMEGKVHVRLSIMRFDLPTNEFRIR